MLGAVQPLFDCIAVWVSSAGDAQPACCCAGLDLQRLYDYYLRTICGLLPVTPRRILVLLAEIGFVAFASVMVAADLESLEQLGSVACRLLLPHTLLDNLTDASRVLPGACNMASCSSVAFSGL